MNYWNLIWDLLFSFFSLEGQIWKMVVSNTPQSEFSNIGKHANTFSLEGTVLSSFPYPDWGSKDKGWCVLYRLYLMFQIFDLETTFQVALCLIRCKTLVRCLLPLCYQTQTLYAESSLSLSPPRWQVWCALSGISPTAGLKNNHSTLTKMSSVDSLQPLWRCSNISMLTVSMLTCSQWHNDNQHADVKNV